MRSLSASPDSALRSPERCWQAQPITSLAAGRLYVNYCDAWAAEERLLRGDEVHVAKFVDLPDDRVSRRSGSEWIVGRLAPM